MDRRPAVGSREFQMQRIFVTAIAVAGWASIAFAQSAPTMTGDSAKGKVLTDPKGMTLYIFDKDADGKSVCNGPCATNWPPLMAASDAKAEGGYSIVDARRWRQAMGLQGQAALYVGEGHQARRRQRRRRRQQ